MLRRAAAALAVLAFLAPVFATSSNATVIADEAKKPRAKQKVILISLDAFRPEVYRDPQKYPMPNLQALAKRGVSADAVHGIFPTVTYPAHSTLVTGVRTARHGIVNNTVFDPRDGGKRWYWEAAHFRAAPLWDVAKKSGLKTAAVRWPCTVGADIDWHIPEAFATKKHWEETIALATPGLVARVWPGRAKEDWEEADIDAGATEATARIIEEHRPDLVFLHLIQADHEQHVNGREHEAVVRAFANLDAHLGRLVKAVDVAGVASETNFIITGDHGFIDIHSVFRPNALLREAGLIKVGPDDKVLDWTAYAHTAGGAAAIYLRDPGDRVAAEKVLAALRSAVSSRWKGLVNLLEREALDAEEAFPGALCAFEGEPGYAMDGAVIGAVLDQARPTYRGTHGYLPSRPEMATGFVAAGPGLATNGRRITKIRSIDVAPLAAHLLGVDLGPAVQGVLVPGLLAPAPKEDKK